MSERRNPPEPPRMMGPRRGGPPGQMVVEKPKDMKKTLKRIIEYISGNKKLFFALIFVMVVITLLGLAAPAIQGWAIDRITLTDGKLNIDYEPFVKLLALLGVTYILSAVFQYLQGIFSAKLSQSTVRLMRDDLFAKMVKLPIKYLDTHRHGDIMSRMTNDVENISNTISQSIGSLISGVLTLTGTLIIMIVYSPLLTLVSMITVVMTISVSMTMSKKMRAFFRNQQVILGKLNGHAEETVTGYKTIVAYSREGICEDEFNSISNEFKNTAIKAQILGGSMGPLMNFIGNVGYLLIAAVGGYLVTQDIITVGIIQAFLIYSKQFTRPINEIANQYGQIQTAIAGAERVFAIMDEADEVDEGKQEPEFIGNVTFEDVVFSYKEGEPVLKNFSLDVKAGQKIALVGATGSGKTTVVNLLTRFYDADSGRILIDGVDVRDISKDALREAIAIVLQDTVLFSDTIKKNIMYAKLDSTMEEIENAAQTANADVFINRLKDGYDTMLSESGTNISEGQRQLLSISRAVLKNPKILILDEATSSVDTRTEMHIQQAMIALMKNRTSIIIAHRLSTIRDADIIVVLDSGRIVEQGSHDELLAMGGCYYRLYQNQFAGNKT